MKRQNEEAPPTAPAAVEVGPETQRFAQALRQAMVRNKLSERRLASELGITIGTTQKYFRFRVHPLKVATGINRELARLLGISLDALVSFYETGEFRNAVSFQEVSTWLRSEAGAEHMVPMLEAISELGRKVADAGCGERTPEPEAPAAPRYDWPLQELNNASVSAALRQRMGLTDEALELLATTGEFDDELVEAFSVAANLDEAAVREAFSSRSPVI
jgi:transcriptional regulator with XRE-family HTH domain